MEAVPISDGKELEQSGKGGDHQGSLYQDNPVSGRKPGSAGNDNGGSDAAHNHGHHVLKGHGEGLGHFRDSIHLEQGSPLGICIHKYASCAERL